MKFKFKTIAVVGRQNTPASIKAVVAVIKYLQKIGVRVLVECDTATILPANIAPTIECEQLGKVCDLVAVIGGDGSFLSGARLAARYNLPVIGINSGELGFLADISPKDLTKVDEILQGKLYQERRFLLQAKTKDVGKKSVQNLAINDVVLLSYTTGQLIELAVYVDEHFLCNYRADGLIVATPTGSTAHALSSGGPILYPSIDNIVLVPILSHNLSSRPIVISGDSKIKIVFEKYNRSDLLVICDGQTQVMLQGGIVEVTKAKEKLRLLHPKEYNYFDILRNKLHWERGNKLDNKF